MSTRYGLNVFALLAGGFLAVASRSFGTGSLEWLAFGVGVAVLLAGVAGIAGHAASTGRRALGRGSAGSGALALVGLWSLVAALVFSGSTLTWLVFADALAVAAIALADLTAHEVTTERVVHTLDVRHEHKTPVAA